jgi:hypothetical protein
MTAERCGTRFSHLPFESPINTALHNQPHASQKHGDDVIGIEANVRVQEDSWSAATSGTPAEANGASCCSAAYRTAL